MASLSVNLMQEPEGLRSASAIPRIDVISKSPGTAGVHVMQDQRSSDTSIEHWSATNHPGGHRPMPMPDETAMRAAMLYLALGDGSGVPRVAPPKACEAAV